MSFQIYDFLFYVEQKRRMSLGSKTTLNPNDFHCIDKKNKKRNFSPTEESQLWSNMRVIFGSTIPLISCLDGYSEKSYPQNIIL